MAKRVTPEDESIRDPEMTNLDGLPLISGDAAEPAAELEEAALDAGIEEEESSAEEAEEASVRRSRRAGKKPVKVNLDEIEEFRRFKAEADRRLEEERKRRLELERQWQEAQAASAAARQRRRDRRSDCSPGRTPAPAGNPGSLEAGAGRR